MGDPLRSNLSCFVSRPLLLNFIGFSVDLESVVLAVLVGKTEAALQVSPYATVQDDVIRVTGSHDSSRSPGIMNMMELRAMKY